MNIKQETLQYNLVSLNGKAISVWLVASLFTCFQFCTQVIAGPMTRELMETYNLNAVTVSYAISSFFYMYLLMQLPAGIILDRYQNRYIMPITCLFCGVGALFMGVADNIYSFVLARMLCGTGAAFGFIGTMRILRNYFPLKYIALFIGFTEMLGFFMTATCENVVSYVLPIIGFKQVFVYLGYIGISLALIIYVAMLKRFSPSYELAPPIKHHNFLADFLELITNKQQWLLGFISFSFFSLVTAFAALWAVPSLVNIHDLSLTASTQAVSSIFIGIAVGGPLMGYLSGRIKQLKILMSWCGLLCAGLILILIQADHLSFFKISLVLFTSGLLSCCYLLCFAIANEITPARLSGTTMGLLNMITMASALIMQPVMGYLVSLNGPIDIINGAPIYTDAGYKRACIALVLLFVCASFLSSRLKIQKTDA